MLASLVLLSGVLRFSVHWFGVIGVSRQHSIHHKLLASHPLIAGQRSNMPYFCTGFCILQECVYYVILCVLSKKTVRYALSLLWSLYISGTISMYSGHFAQICPTSALQQYFLSRPAAPLFPHLSSPWSEMIVWYLRALWFVFHYYSWFSMFSRSILRLGRIYLSLVPVGQ